LPGFLFGSVPYFLRLYFLTINWEEAEMKNQLPARQEISWTLVALCLAVFMTLAGCDDDDSDNAQVTTPTTTASLGNSVKNVQLTSGQPAEIVFTYTLPGDITSRGDYTVDLAGTLANVTLSSAPIASTRHRLLETLRFLATMMIKDAFALNETQVSVFISYAGDADVCSSAYRFGPYTLSGAIGEAVTSSTTTVTPTQPWWISSIPAAWRFVWSPHPRSRPI
jgi:hypothetical protein